MKIEEKVLILENEVNDDMLEEFISMANGEDVESIVIKTDNISSLVVQQLFCLRESKNVTCEDPFLAKFFDDVKLTA